MATSKKAAKPVKRDVKPSTSAGSRAKSRAHDVLDRLFVAWPPLTGAQRKAFGARYSGAVCEEMGGRTRSEGVLQDALEWSGIMAKALNKHPDPLRRYGAARFVWFLDCVRALADAREAQQIAGGTTGVAKARAERAKKAALAARGELLETLEALVEGNDDGAATLAASVGTTDNPDTIITSIGALVALARGWLAREDAESKALAASVGLTLGEVETAEEAASALAEAGADKTIEGRVVPRDEPAVNRAEGRVLLEMRGAMRIFARANERVRDVPRLVPGKATRGVLAPRPARKDTSDGGATVAEPAQAPTDGG